MKRTFAVAIVAVLLGACDTDENEGRIVGQLESDRVEIMADVSEPITEKIVAEGELVTVGQPLMQQDTARINARIAEAGAARGESQARLDELVRGPRSERILAARADLQGADDDLAYRKVQVTRATDLVSRKLAAPELLDRAKSEFDTASARQQAARANLEELLTGTTLEQLEQAEQRLKQSLARLESLNIDLQRHRSVAPVNGRVDSILFEPGERPQAGQPLLVMLAGTQPYARIYVPEERRASTRPGNKARVFVDGIDDPLDGRVRWVSTEAAFTPYFALTERDRGRLTYLAKVDLVDAGERLPDGVPVWVELLSD